MGLTNESARHAIVPPPVPKNPIHRNPSLQESTKKVAASAIGIEDTSQPSPLSKTRLWSVNVMPSVASLVSFGLHLSLLVGFAMVAIELPPPSLPAISLEQPQIKPEPKLILEPEELVVSEDDLNELGALSEQGVSVAEAISPVAAEVSVVPLQAQALIQTNVRVEPVSFEAMGPNQVDQLIEMVAGVNVGAAVTGAAGAVDRLSLEIARSLEDAPTCVCWVFDQSVSLAAQRTEIAARLERVFRELQVDESGNLPSGLTNLVVAYGSQIQFLVNKPTDVSEQVVRAIRDIQIDETGIERTFAAVRTAAERLDATRPVGNSNAMVVVFTDEVGDDQSSADQVATSCRRLDVSVCVVGVPAPFGRRFIEMRYVEFDPSYAAVEDWAVVEQGPETLLPEAIWIGGASMADDAIESGFGPFSLSKLCYQTGGIYIAVHANREARGRVSDRMIAPMASRLRHFFDPEVMRDYQPDYVSVAVLRKKLLANRAKKALVDAAGATDLKPMESPETRFPKKSEGELAALFSQAQRAAAYLEPRIDRTLNVLSRGLPDRDKVEEKRWQAGFDLAMGRLLALKVRTVAYNLMLAQAKAGMPFQNPQNDTWLLIPSQKLMVGSKIDKLAKQAETYLIRVVQEHPGTPWAFQAKKELQNPLGYAWNEIHTGINNPPQRRPAANNNRPAMPQDDKRRMVAPPKARRNLKRI